MSISGQEKVLGHFQNTFENFVWFGFCSVFLVDGL
jgi:hypothetical protein